MRKVLQSDAESTPVLSEKYWSTDRTVLATESVSLPLAYRHKRNKKGRENDFSRPSYLLFSLFQLSLLFYQSGEIRVCSILSELQVDSGLLSHVLILSDRVFQVANYAIRIVRTSGNNSLQVRSNGIRTSNSIQSLRSLAVVLNHDLSQSGVVRLNRTE